MSYARLSEDSDVYVFPGFDGLVHCCWCSLSSGLEFTGTPGEMAAHLEAHARSGDRVPERVLRKMKADRLVLWATRLKRRLGRSR